MAPRKRRTFKIFTTLLKLLRMRSHDIILEYYDVSVYKSDFDNLREDEWFNDNNLTFWYEYLERSAAFTELPHSEQIILLRPAMVFLLAQSYDPLDLKDVLPNFEGARYIFLPINNNTNVTLAEGGSHWSLLVVDVRTERSYYYDTLYDSNIPDAEVVSKKLAKLLGCGRIHIHSIPTPQQHNGSDCGVMVCMLTSAVLQKVVDFQRDSDTALNMHLGDYDCNPSRGRRLISYTILDLISKFGRKIGENGDIMIKTNAEHNEETGDGTNESTASSDESADSEGSSDEIAVPSPGDEEKDALRGKI
ncbi:hypothetical protein V1512DRAFT_261342 [Lipomyces arxii]|uniref:uncharacterized protein n=1 Tax=Lipomyces arxii TaxID=56418 RepID=UPI0034CEDD65